MKLFELLGTITLNNEQAMEKIEETSTGVEGIHGKFHEGLEKAGTWGLKIATSAWEASQGILRGISNIVNNTLLKTDEIDKASQRLGISKQAYQEFDYVLGQNGMDIDSLERGLSSLRDNMEKAADPNSDAAKMFNTLGVAARDAKGELRSTEDVFKEVLFAFTAMEESTNKQTLAENMFGTMTGKQLMPTLNSTSESIVQLINRAHELGLILSDEDVMAGVQLGDTIDETGKAFSTFATEIGVALMPTVQSLYNFLLNDLYPVAKDLFVNDVLPALEDALEKVRKVFAWFKTNGVSIESAFKQIGDAIKVAFGATHPWVGALMTAVEAVDRLTGGNKEEKMEDITVADHVFNSLFPGAGIGQLGNAMRNSAKIDVEPEEGTYGPPNIVELLDKDKQEEYPGGGGSLDDGVSIIKKMKDMLELMEMPIEPVHPQLGSTGTQLETAINNLQTTIGNLTASQNQAIQGSVVLDSGAIVGYLMPMIDQRMGVLVAQKARG